MAESNGEKKLDRIIYFSGDFTEEKAKSTIESLLRYEHDDPTKDILMYIDSYGGYVDSFISIHEAIQLCRCDVVTVCIGKAMSAGQMLLISGKKGKRFMTPRSRVLMHPLSCWSFGNIHEVENSVIESKRLQKVLEQLVIKYTKMNAKQVREKMSKDSFMEAEEALKLGIVDHIVEKPKDLYSKIKI